MEALFNYYYYGTPITRAEFEANVPTEWRSQVKDFTYSFGGYRADEI
jgi:hypothetical protein